MIDACYTLRCDECQRYLAGECQLIAEYGEEAPLRALAAEQGWVLEAERGDRCPDCAGKEKEADVLRI